VASASGVFLPHDPRTPLPTYQYRCTECDHAFEEFQSFTDDALTVCPVCGGRLRKVFNAVGVVFKGSGFYRNDSRAKDTVGSASSKDGSSGSESTTSSASTSGSADSGSGSSSSSSSTATTSSTSTSSTTAGSAAGS
jgi:putative FmdB family regulatory protein